MHRLVLIRHGQSTWNRENRFTGWQDVPLSEQGRAEARAAARKLIEAGYDFDYTFTSRLTRAIHTLNIVQVEMDRMWLDVERDWRLNERHYGALTGLDKAETAAKHGEEQVLLWRRSYDIRPPAYAEGDPKNPASDIRYAKLQDFERPRTESLKDTVARVVPFWKARIAPRVKAGERVLVVAHGNSLRALAKFLDGLSDEEVVGMNIPTGIPLVYELDRDLLPISSNYLGSEAEIASAQHAVASQGKART
jgi:2,3-bisphosphoglycerate-dependent phosphoglycerate mutase